MKKQTAGNNKLLAYVRVHFNTPIFKAVSKCVNEGKTDHAIEWLTGFFNEASKERARAELKAVAYGQEVK